MLLLVLPRERNLLPKGMSHGRRSSVFDKDDGRVLSPCSFLGLALAANLSLPDFHAEVAGGLFGMGADSVGRLVTESEML
jgi:hypothetical protein